jgi:hypothetical protein
VTISKSDYIQICFGREILHRYLGLHHSLRWYSSLTPHYKTQISRTGVTALGGSAKVWGRDVSLAAWERHAVGVALEQEVGCVEGRCGAWRDSWTSYAVLC